MNEADSMSMTPPLSPEDFLLEEPEPSPPPLQPAKETDRIPCFFCLGEITDRGDNLHTDSYWKMGHLARVCNSVPPSQLATDNSASLFTYSWSSRRLLDQDLAKLFLILRQQVNEIQMEASRSGMSFSVDSVGSAYEKRMQINEFLQYLQDICQSDTELSEPVAEAMVGQLHTLLLDMGRLSDLPHHVTQAGTEAKTTAAHQCFHLHLDIYWRILSLFYILQDRQPGVCYSGSLCSTPDQDVDTSLYDQLLHLVLWDLVGLSQLRLLNKVVNGEYLKTPMFSCSCVRELWLLVLRLTQWRSTHTAGESFWVSLHHVLKTLMDLDRDGADRQGDHSMDLDDCRVIVNPPEGFAVQDSTSLCLWIMHSVAQLYTVHSQNVHQAHSGGSVSNYHDLVSLLKTYMASSSISEICLRRHLRTCLHLSRLWEPNTNILVILWNYFYKRLNRSDTFQSSSRTLEGLASVDQGVASLYDRCRALTSSTDDQFDKDSSYQLFLRILGQFLAKLYSTGATQEWKQMKGRIYSKFHQARVRELTDGGLYNLTCLFLTLAITADLEDVASKLCDFYNMLDIRHCTFAKRSVVWRGAFAMMLVYEDRGMDVSFLADRMVDAFEGAVGDFSVAGVDTRHSLWKLMMIYTEGLQEVVEASKSLETSEYRLLCPSFNSLLSACTTMEMRTVLSALQSVVAKFRVLQCHSKMVKMLSKRLGLRQVTRNVKSEHNARSFHQASLQHMDFAGRLWRNVYPFVVQHSQTLTPPEQIADLAATFCLLALAFSPSEMLGNKETVITVFQTFACSDKTAVSVSCRFLGHTLSCEDVMARLSADLKDWDKVVISAWFRCCLHMPEGNQTLAEVTRPVLQLSGVTDIFRAAEMEIPDLDSVPVKFLKAIEKAHRRFQSWAEKMQFQGQITQYFSDVPRHVSAIVRAMAPADTLLNVYRMTGYLVKHCAKLIYVRQDAVVPSLINTMIVPHHVMSTDKALNPLLLSALKETLHLYLQGLGKLSFDRDPFIQRRLKDIVTVYLPKFSLRSSAVSMTTSAVTMVHPVVASLSGSFIQQPLPEAVKFRHFIVGLILNNFLAVKNFSIHPNHSVGWSFLQDMIQRTTSPQTRARDLLVLLQPCLEYLLLLPDQSSHLSTTVLHVLQQMTEGYTYNMGTIKSEEACVPCEKFVSSYFKFSSTGVLKVLEKLAVLQKDIVITVIQRVSDSIRDLEKKRGVGKDQKLRSKYYHVLQLLGDKGNDEISKMKSEGL